MKPTYQPPVELLGRILLSAIFLMSGFGKIMDWSGTVAHMTEKGMPAVPFFLACAIAFELVAGAALLTGCYTRVAATVLFLYLIPVTLIFHNFWTYEGAMRQNQMIHFMKNLAIFGGLLKFAAEGAGRYSFDASGWLRGGARPSGQTQDVWAPVP